ncbi:hypothetical protein O3P69_005809 [Scylla paramamosain]|uniref:FMP27 GFWDK domain-containing protein n=1 Tax=Scylla paramamosain TaxID=85552 RepID=A0AAW0U7C1_SCYPA
MYSLQTVFLVVVVLYYIITRGFPRLLSWLIVANFEDVLIKKSGLSIKVERIGATSSLFNQEERKIFAIKVHDVRIEKEVSERRSRGGGQGQGQGDVGLSRSDLEDAFAQATTSLTSSQNASMSEVIRVRIPPISGDPCTGVTWQFFGVHIMSVSVMFLREKWPECLLHASAEKITLEGATLNQSNIALIGSITGASVQVLQHAWENSSSSGGGGGSGGERRGVQSVGGSQDPSLMECAGSLKLSVEISAETIAAMENISVQLSQPQVTIRERLLTFLEHKALAATPVVPSPHLPAVVSSYTSPEALLYKYWLFLPLKFQMKIEDIGVKFMNGLGQTALQGTLAAIDLQTHLNREGALENLPALLPDFSTELQVDNTRVQGTHDSLVTLNRFNLQTQFVGDRVNMKSEFRWLHISYDDRDLAVWTTYLSRHRDPPLPHLPPCAVDGQAKERVGASARRSSNNNSKSSGGIASAFLQRYCVGLIMELWDVSCGASVAGSSHGRTSLQHARFSVAVSQWIAQVAGELILESLVSTLGMVKHSVAPAVSSSTAAAAPKRTHVWGTPAYVGLCLVQLSSSGPPPSSTSSGKVVRETLPPLQAEALIDNVQLEWSPELAALLTTLFRYFQQIKSCSRRPRARTQRGVEPQVEEDGEVFSNISAKCTNINVFAVSEQKVSIMARVDSLESQKAAGNFKTVISGTKLLRFVPSGTQYSCVKSSEIKGECGQVSEVVVESVNGEVLVSVSDQLHLTWSTTTHMTLLTLAQEVVAFLTNVRPQKDLRAEPTPAEAAAAAAAGGPQEEGGEEQGGLKLQILARGDIRIGAELSHRHHVCFILGDLTYLMANGRISCQSEELQVHFDQHKIMSLSGGKLSRALNSREVREEREAVPELTLRQNKSWKLTVDTWVFTFPYEYNFAEAFSNDLLSIVKWVKLVHKHKPRPFTAASPLPPDLVIKVRHWQVEVGDDPFEVKLRYNYELLEDEYQEGCKRLKALDSRIEELRKTMFLFPTGKIEELYKNLQEKSSETYIKRSKLMYESAPMRTQLFTWTMEDVVIFALADPIFHGTERVVQHMTNIDPDSPWPEEDQQFSTLWCRMVLASCGEWNFRLRDYPQSLLLMKDVDIWGRLIGAEQRASKRAIRTVNVEVGDSVG